MTRFESRPFTLRHAEPDANVRVTPPDVIDVRPLRLRPDNIPAGSIEKLAPALLPLTPNIVAPLTRTLAWPLRPATIVKRPRSRESPSPLAENRLSPTIEMMSPLAVRICVTPPRTSTPPTTGSPGRSGIPFAWVPVENKMVGGMACANAACGNIVKPANAEVTSKCVRISALLFLRLVIIRIPSAVRWTR